MKIIIKAKPGSREDGIEKLDDHNYVVRVTAVAKEGKANEAITRLLAKHFDVSPSLVEIISGFWSKTKVVEIHS